MRFNAYDAFYLIDGCALLRHPDKVGTIVGNEV
jgi:hypothetical protein